MATSKKSGGSAKKSAKKTAAKKSSAKKAAAKAPAKKTAAKKTGAKKPAPKKNIEKVAPANAAPRQAADVVEGGEVRRRDFIHVAAVSFAGVGAGAVVLPLLSQMSASADVLALASVEVDVSGIARGQAIKTTWRKQPIFVRNLTPEEIAAAKKDDGAAMRDPQTLEERTLPDKENWLVTLGVCTHLGCVPTGAVQGELKGDFNGYFCPCHGSHYDVAGRIRKGPAPTNLEVPEFSFISDTVIKIG